MRNSMKLVTWNVENLFRPKAGASPEERAAYRAKLRFLARTLAAIDADVIALQEAGGDDALENLQSALGKGAYPHRRLGREDGRGISVALLSKLRFEEAEDVTAFPPEVLALKTAGLDGTPLQTMGRGALRVRVRKGRFTTDVVNVHLKSKLLTFPGPNGTSRFSTKDPALRAQVAALALFRRTAEAATVRSLTNALVAKRRKHGLVVLGDFNDGPEAATTQLLQGPDGSEVGTRGFDRADAGDEARLWNLASSIPEGRRFSRKHRGQGELLDQIFVSEEYLPRGRGKDAKRRLPVKVDALVENVMSIGDDPTAREGEIRPDHAPVTAVFEVG